MSRRTSIVSPDSPWIAPALAQGLVCARVLLLAAACAAVASPAGAARWAYYTVGSGLPSNEVRALIEAADASVWVATPAGLARFDGQWRPITTEHFDGLAVDSGGTVWAGGEQGRIQWFDASGVSLPTPDIGLSPSGNDDVLCLAAGPAGAMWIGTRSALWHWHQGATGWVADLVRAGTVRSLAVSASGAVWWGEDQGLGRLDAGTPIVTAPPQQGGDWPSDRSVWTVAALADGSVVLGVASGKAWWTATGTAFDGVDLPPGTAGFERPVRAALEDARGRVWIARGDAYRFDRGDFPADPSGWDRTTVSSEEGLNGSEVFALLETQGTGSTRGTRSLWFGTDVGASVLSSFAWTTFATPTGLAGLACEQALAGCNAVGAIAPDPARQVVWFGAQAGLSRLRQGTQWTGWLNQLWGGPLKHPQVRALHVDADGTLWVGVGDDTSLLNAVHYHLPGDDDATWRTLGEGSARWRANAIARDAQGLLWLASGDGAWRLDTAVTPPATTHFTPADGLPGTELTALAASSAAVFVAATGGLARLEAAASGWTPLPLSDALGAGGSAVEVRDLLVCGATLYAATSAGLLAVDAAATTLAGATVLDAADGFANDLRALADPADGFLLVGAGTGLYRLDTDLSLRRWRRLGVGDGLPAEDLLAAAVDGDELWIGTHGDGVATHRFEPPETRITVPPPPVVVNGSLPLRADVEAIDPDSDPGQMQYQWRIGDADWSAPSYSTTITFRTIDAALADGLHAFEARAVDAEYNVDPTPARVTFELDTSEPAPRIDAPVAGAALQGIVPVRGVATDPRFAAYAVVAWRKGTSDTLADTIQSRTPTPVVSGLLAHWDTTDFSRFPDGAWILRVIVWDQLDESGYTQVEVLVDNHAPFSSVSSPVLARGDLGAAVWSVGGEAQLLVPPFAFAGERVITVDAAASTDGPAGYAAAVGPSDLAFTKTVTLRLRSTLQAEQAGPLAIFAFAGGAWTRLGGTRERDEGGSGGAGIFYTAAVPGAGTYALRTDTPAAAGGTVISSLAAEPRFFSPRSGALDGRMSISFALARPAAVKAVVYNRAGRLRRELADGRQLPAGQNVLFWDGQDEDGEAVAAGLYIVCVEADGERVTQVVSVGRN